MEPKTEHAEYAKIFFHAESIQHVCFVKVGVWVDGKLL